MTTQERRLSFALSVFALIIVAFVAAGCETTGPATLDTLCKGPNAVFKDPGFAVQGKRLKDKQWIGRTQESGISVCGWPRPRD